MGKEYNVAMTLTEIRRDPQFLVKPPVAVVEYHTIPTRLHHRLLSSTIIDEISAELSVTIRFQPNTAILEGTHDNIQEAVSRIGSTIEKLKHRNSGLDLHFNQIFRGSQLRQDISHSTNSASDGVRASVLRNEVPDPPPLPEPIPPRPDEPKPERQSRASDKKAILIPEDVPRRKSQLQLRTPQADVMLFGMHISNDLHHELLRKGIIQQLEDKTSSRIYFPRHILHSTLGIPENQTELRAVKQENLVFIHGTREGCETSRRELEAMVKKLDTSLHQIARFGAKYHYEVHGLVHEELRRLDILVETSPNVWAPQPASPPTPPLPNLKRDEYAWTLVRRFDLNDGEDCAWHLRAKSVEDLQAGYRILSKAVQTVSAASYVGRLFFHKSHAFSPLSDIKRQVFQRLQKDFSVKIVLPHGDNIVRIIGSKKMVEAARGDVVKFLDTNWMTMLDMTP